MIIGELLVKIGTDLSDLDKGLSTSITNLERGGQRLTSIGRDLTLGITVPITALGVGALKASIDYESALANVAKTTNATASEVSELSGQFTRMSEEIPVSASALANLGASAAQLGIKTEDIAGFTRVMADLGVATNLTSEEAATALAQLANVTGLTSDEFDNLGSAIVALGNQGASTEAQIVFMAQRIAGAGVQVGLTEQQILAFAAAVADTGIEVEAGGSAISRVFAEIDKAVAKGGTQLSTFAKVSGLSSSQFKKAFETDAAGAVLKFVQGLGGMEAQGKNAIVALDDLGLSEVRVSRALLSLAAKSDNLKDKLALSNDAWRANNALTQEAERFYATTGNQLIVLKNEVVNAARALGDSLVPFLRSTIDVIKPVIDSAAELAIWFGQLPKPVQTGVIAFAAFAAAMGPIIVFAGLITTALAAMAPVAAFLGLSVGAMVAAFALIPAAFGVGIAIGTFLLDKWEDLRESNKKLAENIVMWFTRITTVLRAVADPITTVSNLFKKLFDDVVGHSYVPDMVNGIQRNFARLKSVMVDPVRENLALVTAAFGTASKAMTGNVDALIAVMERQAATTERIKGMRMDLMFETDAEAATKLKTSITAAERELNLLAAMAKQMEPVRQQLEAMAVAAQQLAGMKIDLNLSGSGRAGGTKHDSTDQNPELTKLLATLMPLGDALTEFDLSIVEVNQRYGEHSSILGRLGGYAADAGNALLNAGKAFVQGAANVAGRLVGMFNPLSIATTVFDQAIRSATEKNAKLAEAFDKMVAIVADALAPVVEALIPVFDALTPIIAGLAPILAAVAQVFGAIFKGLMPIFGALLPILRALFPVFKFIGIIATYLGQVFTKLAQIALTVASWIAIAIGTLIRGIGRFLDAIPGLGDFGLRRAGQGLIDLGGSFQDSADEMGKAFTELGKAREEIKKIQLEEPTAVAAAGLNNVSDAAESAALSLSGLGKGAGGPHNAEPSRQRPVADVVADGGAAAAPADTAATPASMTIVFGGVTIQTSGDGEETYRNFYNTFAERARASGSKAMEVLAALPDPN